MPLSRASSAAHLPAPRLGDLGSQLLLPSLLRAPAAAARPERVVAGFVSLLLILVAAASLNASETDPGAVGPFGLAFYNAELATEGLVGDLLGVNLGALADRARMLVIETPRLLLREAPVATVVLLALGSIAWSIPGLFICRGAGMELGRRLHLSMARSFRFLAVRGVASVAAVLLTPLTACLLLTVPIVLGLLLAVPLLDVVGGLLYGVGLLASAVSAFLLLAWIPASWLVLPTVACDGADPFDATQRAFGMVLARPFSLLVHLVVALVQGVVVVGLVWIVADLAVGMSRALAGVFSETASAVAIGAVSGATSEGSGSTASALIAVWNRVPGVLAVSYAVSYAHTASTAVYLNARKFVDGQEPSELWMPGDAAGVVEIVSDSETGIEPDSETASEVGAGTTASEAADAPA